MTPFPGRIWLENWRLETQSLWFAFFGIALLLSIVALRFPRRARIAQRARACWALSISFFFGMWIAGVTLEMMRRAASVSGGRLVLALAAFSLLLAGTSSLAREGFGLRWNQPLRAARMMLALLTLTFVGWFFGALALQENALWNFAASGPTFPRAPEGWTLSLGGAALWSAAARLQSPGNASLRVKNPRAASWFCVGVALFLALPMGAHSPEAASVFGFGAGIFGFKVWRARADCPRFLRSNWRLRGPLLFCLMLAPFFVAERGFAPLTKPFWMQRAGAAWQEPVHSTAFAGLCLAIFWLVFRARMPLRAAIFEKFSQRALLGGALGGVFLAALFYGPAGAIFWAFWPLAGVFFEVLSPRDTVGESTRMGSDEPDWE